MSRTERARATDLGQVSVLHVDSGHAVQPGLAQFWRAGVGLGEAVLQIHQHLRISLMFLHLSRGHQNCSDAFSQVFDIWWESCVLSRRTQSNASRYCEFRNLNVKMDPEHIYAQKWIPDLYGFVAVGTVVDYWQRLLEAGTSNTNHIRYQLTDSNHHLKRKRKNFLKILLI